jgi:hypothetical protein
MVKIQQFHSSAKAARSYITKQFTTPHSSIARDYGGMKVSSVRVAKKIGKSPNTPVNGRRLYNITLTKRRKK